MGTVSRWLLCSFDVSPSFFEHLLAFWNKSFQAHLVLSLLQLCSQPFLQGALAHFSEEHYLETKICAVGGLIATGYGCFYTLSMDEAKKWVYAQNFYLLKRNGEATPVSWTSFDYMLK